MRKHFEIKRRNPVAKNAFINRASRHTIKTKYNRRNKHRVKYDE